MQELKSILLLNIKAQLLHYIVIPRNAKQSHGYRWPSLLSQMAFAIPVRPPRCTTECVGPVNGINKDVSSANDCLVLWIESVSVTYWTETQHCSLCPNGRYDYVQVLLCTLGYQQKTCVQKDRKSHILRWMCQTRIIVFLWTVQSTLLQRYSSIKEDCDKSFSVNIVSHSNMVQFELVMHSWKRWKEWTNTLWILYIASISGHWVQPNCWT